MGNDCGDCRHHKQARMTSLALCWRTSWRGPMVALVGCSQCPAGHTAAWGLAFVELGQHPPLSYARACAVVLRPQGGARGAPGGRACHPRDAKACPLCNPAQTLGPKHHPPCNTPAPAHTLGAGAALLCPLVAANTTTRTFAPTPAAPTTQCPLGVGPRQHTNFGGGGVAHMVVGVCVVYPTLGLP